MTCIEIERRRNKPETRENTAIWERLRDLYMRENREKIEQEPFSSSYSKIKTWRKKIRLSLVLIVFGGLISILVFVLNCWRKRYTASTCFYLRTLFGSFSDYYAGLQRDVFSIQGLKLRSRTRANFTGRVILWIIFQVQPSRIPNSNSTAKSSTKLAVPVWGHTTCSTLDECVMCER